MAPSVCPVLDDGDFRRVVVSGGHRPFEDGGAEDVAAVDAVPVPLSGVGRNQVGLVLLGVVVRVTLLLGRMIGRRGGRVAWLDLALRGSTSGRGVS